MENHSKVLDVENLDQQYNWTMNGQFWQISRKFRMQMGNLIKRENREAMQNCLVNRDSQIGKLRPNFWLFWRFRQIFGRFPSLVYVYHQLPLLLQILSKHWKRTFCFLRWNTPQKRLLKASKGHESWQKYFSIFHHGNSESPKFETMIFVSCHCNGWAIQNTSHSKGSDRHYILPYRTPISQPSSS